MGDNTSTATVLKNLTPEMQAIASEAGALNTEDAAGPEIEGLDKDAAEAAMDAGAPPPLALDIRRVKDEAHRLAGREGLGDRQLAEIILMASAIEKKHGHIIGHAEGFKKGMRHERLLTRARGGAEGTRFEGMRNENDLLPVVPWHRSAQMMKWRWDIVERYRKIHGNAVDAAIGFYYGNLQVPLTVEGPPTNPVFVLNVPPPSGQNANPLIDSCFDLAIGDVETGWFGGPHVLDLSDTNLQYPGAFLYPDQLFMIEAVSAHLKAIRIQYYLPGTTPTGFPFVNPATMPVTAGMLAGTNPVWDRGALVLPPEFFNQFNDVSELAQAIAMVTTICFAWDDRGVGGAENLAVKPVERMCAVPGSARHGVSETSGAGLHLDLPRGYIWCVDRQFQATEDSGGNGLFSAQLRQSASFGFPFSPVSLFGSAGPAMPLGCALEWQLTVHGTSLLPAKVGLTTRERYVPRRRQ
jgi:hypothetical protein